MARDYLEQLVSGPGVRVFHSSLTDLDGLPEAFERAGHDCRRVEMGMGSADNRDLFYRLRERTGHPTLPQVFVDGQFVGGLAGARDWLRNHADVAPARWLGYAGLLPFALALLLMSVYSVEIGLRMLLAYAAVILSFVGAVHWGLAVQRADQAVMPYVASVIPALLAWLALLLSPLPSLLLMAMGFVVWRVWEIMGGQTPLPLWYARLRNHLSVGAVISLVVAHWVL